MTDMWDFMAQRQLTVYNNSDNQMKMEESPVGELVFVTLHHKKVTLAVAAECLTVGHKCCLLIVAAPAAGHYARPAFSNYQHKI